MADIDEVRHRLKGRIKYYTVHAVETTRLQKVTLTDSLQCGGEASLV
jgi:hypothetical protein